MIITLLQFTLSLILLLSGGHFLTYSIRLMSSKWNIKVFFLSLLILGMGTSAPELFVTLQSHLNSESEIAIANILGSNVFNILIISAVVILGRTLIKNRSLVLSNIGFLIFASIVIVPLLWDGEISRLDGFLFLGLFVLFINQSSKEESPSPSSSESKSILYISASLILGFILLFLGSNWIISSSIDLGAQLGISKRIIGLFLVSVGTSLPELAVGIVSLIKKDSDMAIGGIVGSNAFNTLLIPGIAAILMPIPILRTFITVDGVAVLVSTITLGVLVLCYKKVIPRWVAPCLILMYVFYVQFALVG